MFTTKNVVTEKPYVSGQIQPGINIAKITAIESKPSQQGVPGIKFVFETEPVEGLDGRGQQADHVYYLNDDKSRETCLSKIASMAEAIGVRDQLDAVEASTTEDYIASIEPIMKNKPARFKFVGREYKNQNGDLRIKSQLALFSFVESLDVPEEDSKLKFDQNNKYDMKRLVTTDSDDTVINEDKADDDLF